jgi:hypothetical protein
MRPTKPALIAHPPSTINPSPAKTPAPRRALFPPFSPPDGDGQAEAARRGWRSRRRRRRRSCRRCFQGTLPLHRVRLEPVVHLQGLGCKRLPPLPLHAEAAAAPPLPLRATAAAPSRLPPSRAVSPSALLLGPPMVTSFGRPVF